MLRGRLRNLTRRDILFLGWCALLVLGIIVGLSAATAGYLNPIVAAILHNVGSLIVIFNSARLVRKGEELEHYHPEAAGPDQQNRRAQPPM